MATRSSARLAVLSPQPLLGPFASTAAMSDSKLKPKKPSVSTVEWAYGQLDQYNVEITETSDITSLLPKGFTTDKKVKESMHIPEMLFSDSSETISVEGDLLIHGFFDTLRMIQTILKAKENDGESASINGLEEYTRQLLSDFVRILFLSNKSLLGEGRSGEVQIHPPNRMSFDIAGVKYVVLNDGSVTVVPSRKDADKLSATDHTVPILFEATQYHLTNDKTLNEKKVPGQVVALLFGSLLDQLETEAFVLHIQCTKVYVYRAQFPAGFLRHIRLGEKATEAATIYRYPKEGFDLGDAKQRKDLYTTLFDILRYSASRKTGVNPQNENSIQQVKDISTREIVVINGTVSEGDRFLNSLQSSSSSSPKRKSPKRSPSPKRPTSPKRKHNPDGDLVNESPRPTKRTATEETKSTTEAPKQVKLNSFGFGAPITSSPWAIPATQQSPPKSEAPKKTFGFGAASSGISSFSAIAQSSSAWSGWDNQKPTVFEKKALFTSPAKPDPPKKEEPADKKVDGDVSEDDLSGDENGGEESGNEDFESQLQLENGDESDMAEKNVDMREQAGEAHEETLFETTCTLYETDPKTASWVSKGTGVIHVNIDKDSSGTDSRNSRIIMRQKGTMKVMWNIRLFKGMQLLPRQVSDGDRRMDVYIKMVLVDDGKPKSYAIKLRNHMIMDQLYDAIEEAIPTENGTRVRWGKY